MSWLSSLPHQIPFRAASAVVRRDATTIEGDFLCTANDVLPDELMLVEGMAQFAGGLALESAGFLSGIDACTIEGPIEPGDVIRISLTLEASFAGVHRFSGTALRNGVEVGRGRFYLAAQPPAEEG